jgi:hypothetical protein
MLTVPPVATHVHSGCDPIGMLAVALPALLVATGANAGGVPLLAGAFVSVPHSCPVPAARFTFFMVRPVMPEGAVPAVKLVNGKVVELATATLSQNGTFWIALKYWPAAQVGAVAAAAGETDSPSTADPTTADDAMVITAANPANRRPRRTRMRRAANNEISE